jgi:hypothetical protein
VNFRTYGPGRLALRSTVGFYGHRFQVLLLNKQHLSRRMLALFRDWCLASSVSRSLGLGSNLNAGIRYAKIPQIQQLTSAPSVTDAPSEGQKKTMHHRLQLQIRLRAGSGEELLRAAN